MPFGLANWQENSLVHKPGEKGCDLTGSGLGLDNDSYLDIPQLCSFRKVG